MTFSVAFARNKYVTYNTKTTLQQQVVQNTYMYFGFWLWTWNCMNQKQPSPFMNFGHWFIQQLLKLPNKP